ncbi:MAG: CDP-diacylglycerol-phosphatidylglycerol phosphatidyltransferase [Actinomycetia bacterium]|jgi:cardiolipin synthase|nr:CDP-diacylglycerol-phosphatidylglycerol phosphatidyltransferase [Actinomycetes bacterium]
MPASSAVVTVPNILSFARIATIPLFCWLAANERTRVWGILLFAVVVSTDWVDGYVARRTGQVTELGRILDPVADRLAIAAGLVTFAIAGIFPFWAALLILVRDVGVVLGGAVLLWGRNIRVDVRGIGKIATFSLMAAIAWIAWGNADGPLGDVLLVGGWLAYVVGIVEYYLAAGLYAIDVRDALAERGMLEE